MITRKEMTDICIMELSVHSDCPDIRKIYRRCAEIAQKRGCSDRVFADAWYNAVQWHTSSRTVALASAEHVA